MNGGVEANGGADGNGGAGAIEGSGVAPGGTDGAPGVPGMIQPASVRGWRAATMRSATAAGIGSTGRVARSTAAAARS